MPIKKWSLRKLILLWIIAIGQVWILVDILTRPFPVRPESKAYLVVVTTVMMIAESAVVMSVAMLVFTWKWLHARRHTDRYEKVRPRP
jgi:hypothetical protein